MKKTLHSAACLAGALLLTGGPASAQEAPAPAAPAPDAPPDAPTHTVAPGDHLWGISAARLGAGERWIEIYASNVEILDSPDQIEAGQVLKIPTAPVEVPPNLLAGVAPAPASNQTTAETKKQAPTRSGATRSSATRSSAIRPSTSGGSGSLARIRQCESGGNYRAVSSGGKYRGAYQFDQQTWQSVGGSGDPAAASSAEQDSRAQQLQSQRGNSPWRNCG